MQSAKDITDLIKTVVLRHLPGAEVNLFGSRARGNPDPDSDYDILVITGRQFTPKEKMPLKTSIRRELLSFNIRGDILIQSREEIRIKRHLSGHIIRNILKEAILL